MPIAITRANQREARRDVEEMMRIHNEKRAAERKSAATPDSKKQRSSREDGCSHLTEKLFAMEKKTQRNYLKALMLNDHFSIHGHYSPAIQQCVG